jgi:hypothetical protein
MIVATLKRTSNPYQGSREYPDGVEAWDEGYKAALLDVVTTLVNEGYTELAQYLLIEAMKDDPHSQLHKK